METEELIEEREKTHGPYALYCFHAQRLKDAVRNTTGWSKLDAVAKETLEANACKTARILTGDPKFIDHWDDQAGYSKQAARYYGG